LVTFLLMTAVFSRLTIVQLDLPSSAASSSAEPPFRLEVIVRKEGFELTNGTTRIAAIPKVGGEYDLKGLSELALSLKRDHPQVDNASVLMEPEVDYNNLIAVMDAIRSTEVPASGAAVSGDARLTRLTMFTKIALGDAP
jgi:biopolymer transport protein ExbD